MHYLLNNLPPLDYSIFVVSAILSEAVQSMRQQSQGHRQQTPA